MMTRRFALAAAAATVCGITNFASAALQDYTFTITGGSSSLAVGGQFGGNSPSAQPGTTLSTSYSGTIFVQIDRATNQIYFPGGSQLNAGNQPSNVQPRTDGTPGSQPGNYGREGTVNSFTPIFGTEALRGLVLDIETAEIGTPTSFNPSTGQFASNSIGLLIDAGESDFAYGTQFGEIDLSGNAFLGNSAAQNSSLTSTASVETLTLRFVSSARPYSVAQTNDSNVTFSGTIIATRPVPEPAAFGALALAGGSLLARRRRG